MWESWEVLRKRERFQGKEWEKSVKEGEREREREEERGRERGKGREEERKRGREEERKINSRRV